MQVPRNDDVGHGDRGGRNPDTNPNTQSDANANPDANAHIDTDDTNTDPHAYTNTDTHPNAYFHAFFALPADQYQPERIDQYR